MSIIDLLVNAIHTVIANANMQYKFRYEKCIELIVADPFDNII